MPKRFKVLWIVTGTVVTRANLTGASYRKQMESGYAQLRYRWPSYQSQWQKSAKEDHCGTGKIHTICIRLRHHRFDHWSLLCFTTLNCNNSWPTIVMPKRFKFIWIVTGTVRHTTLPLYNNASWPSQSRTITSLRITTATNYTRHEYLTHFTIWVTPGVCMLFFWFQSHVPITSPSKRAAMQPDEMIWLHLTSFPDKRCII